MCGTGIGKCDTC